MIANFWAFAFIFFVIKCIFPFRPKHTLAHTCRDKIDSYGWVRKRNRTREKKNNSNTNKCILLNAEANVKKKGRITKSADDELKVSKMDLGCHRRKKSH